MTAQQKRRMALDITMTILSLILMGGAYFFPWDGVHEILGTVLLVLWAVHVILNRRWYKSLFKGSYNPFRVMQAVVNCAILVCAVFLMISGIMLSNHVFAFLHIESGTGFARVAHLLASHWYLLFMSLHIGMHVGMISRQIMAKRAAQAKTTDTPRTSKARTMIFRVILALVCAYGLYAFISRGVWKYLILRQEFFFFDMEKGYLLFFTDYVAIVVLFATAMRLICKRMERNAKNSSSAFSKKRATADSSASNDSFR